MESTTKKVMKGIGWGALVAILVGAGVGATIGVQKLQSIVKGNETTSSSASSSSSSSNSSSSGTSAAAIAVKGTGISSLSTGIDSNGHATQTFNYTISPSTASNQNITLALGWTSTGVTETVSSYLTASQDSANKTITLTCLAAFSNQATLKIASVADPTKSASVTVDYEKKFLGWGTNNISVVNVDTSASSSYAASTSFDELVAARSLGYSVYSVDKTYTPTYTLGSPTSFLGIVSDSATGTASFVSNEDNFASFGGTEHGTMPSKCYTAADGYSATFDKSAALSQIQAWVASLTDAQKAEVMAYAYIGYYFTQPFNITLGGVTTTQSVQFHVLAPKGSINVAVSGISAESTSIKF